MPNLFKRIGGERAVQATVTRMYEKILADEELAPFFENVDVERLRHSQRAFVTYAFGGTNHYDGRTMRSAHENAVSNGLGDRHFDRVVGHLREAMRELHVAPDLINEAIAIVEATRADVLNR